MSATLRQRRTRTWAIIIIYVEGHGITPRNGMKEIVSSPPKGVLIRMPRLYYLRSKFHNAAYAISPPRIDDRRECAHNRLLVIAEWDRATRSMWDGLQIIKSVIDAGWGTRLHGDDVRYGGGRTPQGHEADA
jgi:hypothetical protein